ncbi:MAG: polymer-forming cytoskeletal protein [Butyrivibrio sp.]|nr:polymer-forming cytoskeletal protein [Butyrivibrio sp.]
MVNNAVNSAVKTLHAAEAVEKNVEAKEEASKAVDNVSAVYETSDNKAQNDMEMAATLNTAAENNNGGIENMSLDQKTPTDEVASITEGMVVNGDIETTGSLDIVGKVVGNVSSLGKLNVSGEIEGDSKAAEFYADSARIAGEVRSDGSVKVGQSTVIIGNIYATSAVIAGAVRGDIDVHGPVVLDTTAIVMGNIKSQSVQINNGAVIEGMCSQAYAEVNPSAFFDGLKKK